MSANATLLLYFLLEQGTLHDTSGQLLRPACADGLLQPPLIDAVRAQREGGAHSPSESQELDQWFKTKKSPRIDFPDPKSDVFTVHVPDSYFFTKNAETVSCFG